ncbi:MAG: DUF418 domain-containing protein [Sphingobium sp.]|nr:DUF418 domain-containing protein [Sphingobium sp.]
MTDDSNRIDALDFLRGIAVMGILLANMVAIGLPSAAQLNPFTLGTDGPLDLAAWVFNLLLVDGKFRALFAMMFGASMLLVMESAELDGRDGLAAHRKRMIWLAVFGVVHHLLIWSGDILLPLALAGLVASSLAGRDTLTLVKWALGLLALQWAIDLVTILPPFSLRSAALAPGASADIVARWQALSDSFGGAGSHAVAADVALHRSGYGAILSARASLFGADLINMVRFVLPELLAFMALGMAMLKGGFLSAQWLGEQYRATWRRAYPVGLLPMAGLAAWVLISGDPLAAEAAGFGWSLPLRLPLAVAHAALALGLAIRFPDNALVGAVRAVGRLALSNYLLCSLVATTMFYGYGAGLFGRLDRAALLLCGFGGWAIMLLWSVLWRRYWRQGPAEWLWRRLVRGKA